MEHQAITPQTTAQTLHQAPETAQPTRAKLRKTADRVPVWVYCLVFCVILAATLTIFLWPKSVQINTPTTSNGTPEEQAKAESEISAARAAVEEFKSSINTPDTDEHAKEAIINQYEKKLAEAKDEEKFYLGLEYAVYYYENIEKDLERIIGLITSNQNLATTNLHLADQYETLEKIYTLAGDTEKASEAKRNAETMRSTGFWYLNGDPVNDDESTKEGE